MGMKVLWIFSHPAPYKVDFFNELGKRVELTAIFERDADADREKLFYGEKAKNFKAVFPKRIKLGPHNVYCPGIIKYFAKRDYDIVVVNGWSTFAEMKVIRYLKRKKIPYVFAINGGLIKDNESPMRKRFKKRYISGANLYLCPDENSASYLEHYGAEKEKIAYYPYSTISKEEVIDKPIPKKERLAFYEKQGVKAENVFICVGQLIERKNPITLVRYFAKCDPKDALVFLGSGPLKREIEAEAQKLGLNNVYLLGFKNRKETLEFFANSDASIFLTGEDIYGHVVNESLSQGTPVIGNWNSNSARKLIDDGYNGFHVNDEKSFLMAIQNIKANDLRSNCIQTASNETLEAMADRHMEIFEDYLK